MCIRDSVKGVVSPVKNIGEILIYSLIKTFSLFFTGRKLRPPGIGIEAIDYVDLPRVLEMPVEVYMGRGLIGRLDCVVDANPPVSQIVWTKNERPLNLAAIKPRVYVDRRGSLVFRPADDVDDGRYACAAYSSLGAGHSSTTVRVYVRGDV